MARAYTFPTCEDVISQALAETIGSTEGNVTALQTEALLTKLDNINRCFVGESHQRNGGAWSWMQDVTNFQTYADTTLNGALTTASTSVILTSGTNFDTAGRIWVKTSKGAIDFIDHTGKSSHTLSGATDIDMSHADGEKVGKCYALPSTYAKARALHLDEVPYSLFPQPKLPVHATYYTRGGYIVLPEGVGSTDATFWFEKSPTSLDTGDSTADLQRSMDIPVDYQWYAIYMLMAYIQRNRRKRQDAMSSEQLAGFELEKALNDDVAETTPQILHTDY